MEENARKGIYKPGLMLLTLPECNRLPSMHQDPKACTRIPHFGKWFACLAWALDQTTGTIGLLVF